LDLCSFFSCWSFGAIPGVSATIDIAIVSAFVAHCTATFGFTKENLKFLVHDPEIRKIILTQMAVLFARAMLFIGILIADDALKAIPLVGTIIGMAVGVTISAPLMATTLLYLLKKYTDLYMRTLRNDFADFVLTEGADEIHLSDEHE